MDRRSRNPRGQIDSSECAARLRRAVQQLRAEPAPADALTRALRHCRAINSAKSLWFYAMLRGAAGEN